MSNDEARIVHRELERNGRAAGPQVAEVVADLEGRAAEDLSPTWDCIDDVLEHVFSDPPSPEAQVEVTFSYEGYRVTVEQNGTAEFVKPG